MARQCKQPAVVLPSLLNRPLGIHTVYLNQQSGHLPACEAYVAAVSTTALKITEAATSHLRIGFIPFAAKIAFASAKFQTGHCLPSAQERSTVRQQPFLSGIFGNVTQDIKAMCRQPLRTGFRGPGRKRRERGVGRLRWHLLDQVITL